MDSRQKNKNEKEEKELSNGILLYKSQFCSITSYFEEEIIEFVNHNRKYKLDMKKEDIKNNKAIQSVIPYIEGYADMLEQKDTKIDKEFQKIIQYNHLSALEYLFMKTLDDIEKKEKKINHSEEEQCCICQCELYDNVNGMQKDKFQEQIKTPTDDDVIQLKDCDGHFFHFGCLKQMLKQSYIKCPICTKIYGVMKGDQPSGQMTYSVDKNVKCSGYNCPSIIINYSINGGVRNGKNHPGTHRTAYLPDNQEGREVFELLKIAFDRQLTFTVGRSVTTGQDNVVVWNGIHHKTSPSGGSSNFGFPDPTYFNRVKQELALKGVK